MPYITVADDMSVPLLLAVVGGCILFLAVLIPAIFFICRYCCNKAPVGVTDPKPRQQSQVSPLHTTYINRLHPPIELFRISTNSYSFQRNNFVEEEHINRRYTYMYIVIQGKDMN